MNKNKRGFTLAELLVVVAIIAVLVAIAIPIFTNQLEKSREATDAANIRSQYAEVMTDGITNGGDINANHNQYAAIELKQTKSLWQTTDLGNNLNSLFGTHIEGDGPNKGGIAWVSYDSKMTVLFFIMKAEAAPLEIIVEVALAEELEQVIIQAANHQILMLQISIV